MQNLIGALGRNFFLVFAVLAFIAVVLLIEGAYLSWNAARGPEARRLGRRLVEVSAGGDAPTLSIVRRQVAGHLPRLDRWLARVPRLHRLDRLLAQSGLAWSITTLLTASVLCGLGVALGVALLPGVPALGAVGASLVAAALPALYVRRRARVRLQRFERQLPDALDLIARALRAGHAFPSALKMIGEEMSDPIGAEFRMAYDEINYGVTMAQALGNLAARVGSTDLRYFVIAVLIQREAGGNLAEILGNLAALIRQRLTLFGKVRVLSAEGRLSAWILAILPFALAGVIELINPRFLSVLHTDPLGVRLVVGALLMMALGIVWMRHIVRIRV